MTPQHRPVRSLSVSGGVALGSGLVTAAVGAEALVVGAAAALGGVASAGFLGMVVVARRMADRAAAHRAQAHRRAERERIRQVSWRRRLVVPVTADTPLPRRWAAITIGAADAADDVDRSLAGMRPGPTRDDLGRRIGDLHPTVMAVDALVRRAAEIERQLQRAGGRRLDRRPLNGHEALQREASAVRDRAEELTRGLQRLALDLLAVDAPGHGDAAAGLARVTAAGDRVRALTAAQNELQPPGHPA